MNKTVNDNIWYNLNHILSYRCLISVVVGNRGYGKTYGAKKKCIKDFKDKKEMFVWVRRYKSELTEAKKTFFNAIKTDKELLNKYGEIDYRIDRDEVYIDGELAGHLIPLSVSSTYKSSEYPRVRNIVFDEFIIDSGKLYYMKNEVNMLYGLIETVQRHRDNVRVIMIGNAIKFNNPYFIHWKIKPFKSQFLHLKNRSIVIEFTDAGDFREMKKQSRIGALTQGTAYHSMAIDNHFEDDNDIFIEKKTDFASYICSIKYEDHEVGFWFDSNVGKMFANMQVDSSSSWKYTVSEKDHDINYFLIKNYRGTHLKQIIECYQLGVLMFSDIRVKGIVLEVMSLFVK